MKNKTLILISFIIMVAYIGYLKVVGLNDLDMSNLLESIKPLIPHSLALVGAFIFNLIAYLKQKKTAVLGAAIFSILSIISYIPVSLVMIAPLAVLAYAYIKMD